MRPAKTAQPINMPFGLRTRVGQETMYWMGIQIAPWVEAILRGEGAAYCQVYGHSAVSCAKTAETIKMPFGIWTRVGQRNHVLDGDPDRPI